tara:strand:- start:712 stop:1422 length:711 start_codon:yes stop_codon:yes gene_type:complete
MWWTMLKRKGDVDFTSDHHPFYYATGDPSTKGIGGEYIPRHPDPAQQHSIQIYLGGVRRILEFKLERAPTDKELIEEIISTLKHEGAHAAHDEIDPDAFEIDNHTAKTIWEAEFVAFHAQYNDKLYTIYWSLLHHPGSANIARQTVSKAVRWAEKIIPKDYVYSRMFDNKWGRDLEFAARDKLLFLYMTKVKRGGDTGIWNDLQMTQAPKSKKEAISMFGQKEEEFVRTLKLPNTR